MTPDQPTFRQAGVDLVGDRRGRRSAQPIEIMNEGVEEEPLRSLDDLLPSRNTKSGERRLSRTASPCQDPRQPSGRAAPRSEDYDCAHRCRRSGAGRSLMDDAFATAMAVLERAPAAAGRFSETFLTVFPVDGASVSTLGDVLGTEIVSTTGADARKLDELQFDLGEGPCWDAMRLGEAVAEADLAGDGVRRWPAFAAAAAQKVPAASIYAFPVAVGSLRFGAVDLFTKRRLVLSPHQTRQAGAMARVIGRQLLREAVDRAGDADSTDTSRTSRRVVHQATGVVLAQLEITAEEALLVIQGHAFAMGEQVTSIASDIVERRLRFRRVNGEIEAVE